MRIRSPTLLLFVATAPAQQWTALDGPQFLDRFSAYDTHRHRLVAFSGNGETFEYGDLQLLHRPRVSGMALPPARTRAGMAYDPLRRHVLMYGGLTPSGHLGDTWAFDGQGWRLLTAGGQPLRRSDANLVFDSARGFVVMLGGDMTTPGDGTWEHDGSAWLSRGTAGPGAATCMAYDSGRGVTVIVSGNSAPVTTWEWNGLAWSQRATAVAPAASGNQSMGYDPARQRVVLFGGASQGVLWEWDGNAWSQIRVVTALQRLDPAMWFEPALGKMVIAGGIDNVIPGTADAPGSARTDAWSWDGAVLVPLRGDHRPSSRHGHVLCGDLFRGQIVLFGGADTQALDDTWTWDGNAWTERQPSNRPPARSEAAAAFDWTRGEGLLFGGGGNGPLRGDLWAWNGIDWSLRSSSGGGPAARSGAAMAHDLIRDRSVLFGGFTGSGSAAGGLVNDTWEWTGAAWLPRAPATSPPPRVGAAMAHDVMRGRTVLFGGRAGTGAAVPLADTWEWDGSNWQQVLLPGAPPALAAPSLGYDLARLRVVLSGREFAGGLFTFHVWEYSGVAWTQVSAIADSPNAEPCAILPSAERLVCAPSAALHEFSATRAAVDVTGPGCGSPASAPLLLLRARPRVGAGSFGLECLAAPGLATVFGFAATAGPVSLGSGCTVWLGPPSTSLFTLADATGMAALPLPIPRHYALRGLSQFAQAAVLDAASPLGVRLSQGLRFQVGD